MSLASEGKLIAPNGKFRVIGVDTFEDPDDADFLIGDFDKETAIQTAKDKANPAKMFMVYVYDDEGKLIWEPED